MPLCSSTIFTLEYGFDAAQTVSPGLNLPPRFLIIPEIQGLTNLGGIVGIVLALFITGFLIDWSVVWMSKRNRGIYEPEFRLLFMSSMLFGVFGYFGWAGKFIFACPRRRVCRLIRCPSWQRSQDAVDRCCLMHSVSQCRSRTARHGDLSDSV